MLDTVKLYINNLIMHRELSSSRDSMRLEEHPDLYGLTIKNC